LGEADARHAALTGGDDYILAFTLPPAHLAPLLGEGWPVHVIGSVQAGSGVTLVDAQGQDITPLIRGYQHFRETP
jgi:thiamine-monophosphate kinase